MTLQLPEHNIEPLASQASPSVSPSTEAQMTQHNKTAAEMHQVINPEQPFHQTPFGKLPLEIRQKIFVKLLATPPLHAGREVSVPYHLKASHLAILRTCRQVYLEAFENFYGRKSYYAANAQELCHILNFGHSGKPGPECFRSDVVTMLCVRGLRGPGYRSTVKEFMGTFHYNAQAHPPAFREVETFRHLDRKVLSTMSSLESWTSPCKIGLCMQAGDEGTYVDFLSRIPNFGQARIRFENDNNWTIYLQLQKSQKCEQKFLYLEPLGTYFKKPNSTTRFNSKFVPLTEEEKMEAERCRGSGHKDGDERYVEVHVVRQAQGDSSMDSSSEDTASICPALLSLTTYFRLGVGLIALFLAYTFHVFMNEGPAHTVAH